MRKLMKKPVIRRHGRRGIDRPSHRTGRYSEIPVRVITRLMSGHSVVGARGCWMPLGSLKAEGYKHTYWTDKDGIDRTLTAQHLIARVFHRCGGVLDDDEVAHHTCVNAWCINPDHIEVTERDAHIRTHVALRRKARG